MVDRFVEWMEKGYGSLGVARKPSASTARSYRFFARGPGKDLLACGVVRDSVDAVGRPYPLLLAGCGPLAGWEQRWDLLPLACERTWMQMESSRAGDVAQLGTWVHAIRPPEGDWAGLEARRGAARDSGGGFAERIVEALGRPGEVTAVEAAGSEDPGVAASRAFCAARERRLSPPSAVFIGGTFERTVVALFNRPLAAADFRALWADAADGERN